LISTAEGMKKIEEIEVGDIVWSHNSENGEKELKEVKELFRFNKNSTITLKINGEEIVTTDLHLFYTLEKSWTSAKDLELGDTVVTLSGEKYKIEAIDKDYYDGIIVVYNFEVEDNHNYYVGDNQVLVHNDGCTVSDKGSSGGGIKETSVKFYYHVTTEEIADKIILEQKLGRLGNSWETRVFAWTKQPSITDAKAAGIGSRSQTVLKFKTNASFELDKGIENPKIKYFAVQTTDAQRVPIDIFNVEKVGFKKRWWEFWKN